MSKAPDPGSVIVAAIEAAYEALRANHPDLPGAVIILGSGRARRGGRDLRGHYVAQAWRRKRTRTTRTPEIFIAGEFLRAGSEVAAFETLLHEAAHALADARGLKETSRQGRYHNGRFLELAEELGLKHAAESPDPGHGFNQTVLQSATKARYAAAIDGIGQALVANRLPDPHTDDTRDRNYIKAACGCPDRIIRLSRRVHAQGGVLCQLCQREFRQAD